MSCNYCDDDYDGYYDEYEEECDFCHGDSLFAYEGVGSICLRYKCRHWGGDNICMLAIEIQIAEEEDKPGPDDICPLLCPNCN